MRYSTCPLASAWIRFDKRCTGHANFLDVLVDSLEPDEDDEDAVDPAVSPSENDLLRGTRANSDTKLREHDDEDSTSSEDDWSDSSDDDYRSLVRTASLASILNLAVAARAETEAAMLSSGDDYFSNPRYGEPVVTNDAGVTNNTTVAGRDEKYETGVMVAEVASPMSDLMDELRHSPMEAPLAPLRIDDRTSYGRDVSSAKD